MLSVGTKVRVNENYGEGAGHGAPDKVLIGQIGIVTDLAPVPGGLLMVKFEDLPHNYLAREWVLRWGAYFYENELDEVL